MGSARVTGDFGKLTKIANRFSQGNVDKALELANKNMAEEALNLVSEGFSKGQDPYGKAWNAPNDLQITGGIRRYTYELTGKRGFRVHSTDQKAVWHHSPQPRPAWGGKKLPTRLQVPTTAKGLPKKWTVRLRKAASDAFKIFRR
jgi:hypothetical protein